MDTIDSLTPYFEAFKPLWWMVPLVALVALMKVLWMKGVIGEAFVFIMAKLRLPSKDYHRLHDVTLSDADGTTQIDHIFASRFGIFIVETKNMKGWIFGSEKQPQWTQKLYRKSFAFQNPLRQNYKHTQVLGALLDIDAEAIHSVVAFVGSCAFKTTMPVNVTRGGAFVGYIKSFKKPVLSETQVRNAVNCIEANRLSPSLRTSKEHVAHLKKRHR